MKITRTSLWRMLAAALLLGLAACASEQPAMDEIPEAETILHEPIPAESSPADPLDEESDKKRRPGGESDDMDRVN